MHVLLFSTDPVALDAVVCRMIHLDESMVEPIVYGNEFGLGSSQDIEILGDPIEKFDAPNFVVNRQKRATTAKPDAFNNSFMRNYVTPRPVILAEKCIKCGRCVDVCPADPKALSWANGKQQIPVYDYSHCIRCYCCQELCPNEAITVVTPLLGRIIGR
jgi:Pyruvate/2-oxoacid:ferredoxin oxidoreductase delta subunit